MKPCPICHTCNCIHKTKFYNFGLLKIKIIEQSLIATSILVKALGGLLPTNTEMGNKINFVIEDLEKCKVRVTEIHTWLENTIKLIGVNHA